MIAALVELVDIRSLRALYRVRSGVLGPVAARPDFAAALAALVGVLVFDTLPGLFIGIAISVLLLVYRASRPHVAVLGRAPEPRTSGRTSHATRRTPSSPVSS